MWKSRTGHAAENSGHWPSERRQRVKPGRRCSKGRSQHEDVYYLSLWRGRKTNRLCLIQRTAVYGPVRTVVWEGRSRETPPYPDWVSRAIKVLVICFSQSKEGWHHAHRII
jgi:hypothetical protein